MLDLSGSQSSLHRAWAPQVTVQSPVHFTSQVEVSWHEAVLPAPSWNLQSAWLEQVADEPAPAFRSHLEAATQEITLASPALPLHSELSLQVSMAAPMELVLHLAPVSQRTAQPAVPQVVLQSTPAWQVQLFSTAQVHPVPVQVAARPASSVEQAASSSHTVRRNPGAMWERRMIGSYESARAGDTPIAGAHLVQACDLC
jgi:hypothetical protein